MEIERKFFIPKIPQLVENQGIDQERFVIFKDENTELRVQRKGDRYEIERKSTISSLSRTKEILIVSVQEYESLKRCAEKLLSRKAFILQDGITLKVYLGDYQGLARAEVEFTTEREALDFMPPEWFGIEITSSPLGKDGELLKLSKNEFKQLLQSALSSD